jgi:hypothetical protein
VKLRKIECKDDGSVVLQWETTSGQVVTVKPANTLVSVPAPLADALRALMPAVAAFRGDPGAEERIAFSSLAMADRETRSGEPMTIIRIQVTEAGGEKPNVWRSRPLALEGNVAIEEASVDMQEAVGAIDLAARDYCRAVYASLDAVRAPSVEGGRA